MLRSLKAHRAELFAVAGLVAAATVLVAVENWRVTEWGVMTDELLYTRLSLGVAGNLSPLSVVHGESVSVYNMLYPLMISPLTGFFDLPTAFRLIHIFNSLLMVSAAIPTYLLAREVTRSGPAAWIAAALAVLVPWMTLTTSVMTESVAYPAFVWAVLAIVRAIARPSARRDLVALAAILVAYLARTQFLVIALVFPVAIVVNEIAARAQVASARDLASAIWAGLRGAVMLHRLATGCLVLGALVVAVGGTDAVLGSYSVTVSDGGLLPAGWLDSAFEHLAYVVVGIGALPLVFGLGLALASLGRDSDPTVRALAAFVVVSTPAITLAVTSFDLRFAGGIQERYLFYICPPLFVATVAWFAHPRPIPALRLWLATSLAALMTVFVVSNGSYSPGIYSGFASPNRFSYAVLDRGLSRAADIGMTTAVALACAIAFAAIVLIARSRGSRPAMLMTTGAIGGFLALQLLYIFPKIAAEHNSIARNFFSTPPLDARDWVDDRGDRLTGLVQATINARNDRDFANGFVDAATWWQLEFWNKSVDRVYAFGGRSERTLQPEQRMGVDLKTGLLRTTRSEQPQRLVLAESDPRFAPEFRDRPIKDADLMLYETPLPLRADWASSGISETGWTPHDRPSTIRVFAPRGRGTELRGLRVLLYSATDGKAASPYRITGPGVTIRGSTRGYADKRFDLCVPAGRYSDLSLDFGGRVKIGPRQLSGGRVLLIASRPTGRACELLK